MHYVHLVMAILHKYQELIDSSLFSVDVVANKAWIFNRDCITSNHESNINQKTEQKSLIAWTYLKKKSWWGKGLERREEKDERVDFIVFCVIAETESPDWPDLLEEISD